MVEGTSTLVWAYRLGRDFAELLAEPGFVVAELVHGDIPDRPSDLRWAMEWDIEILVRYRD